MGGRGRGRLLKETCAYCRIAEEVKERAKDAQGNVYMTIEEIKKQDEERRAGNVADTSSSSTMPDSAFTSRGLEISASENFLQCIKGCPVKVLLQEPGHTHTQAHEWASNLSAQATSAKPDKYNFAPQAYLHHD